MFGTVLLTVISLMHIYLFWRTSTVPFIKRRVSKKVIIGMGIFIFLLGRLMGHGNTSALAVTLEFLGMNWMAVVFLMAVSMLTADIITGFGFILPRLAPFLRGSALAVGALLSVTALVQGLRPPVIMSFEILARKYEIRNNPFAIHSA